MSIAASLLVEVGADTSGAEAKLKEFETGLQSSARSLASTGTKLTAGITAPIVGMGTAAVLSATSFNESMANVQTLLTDLEDPIGRIDELKVGIQDLSVSTGKSTNDLAGGAYQVISAFGDTSDTLAILDINARAAAAGLATTEQAIALTSAVTKGYGDTSAAAVQQAADLAFQTVKMGQTTFPELAASMGKVVPLAATLGVTQEELNAQFATLTGVTGNASEVSTQLRATYQALLKPTTEMAGAIAETATKLENTGQLIENEFTARWRDAKDRLVEVSNELMQTKSQMATLEAQGQTGSKTYKQLATSLKDLEQQQKDAKDSYTETAAALGQSVVESVGYNEALQMLSASAGGSTDQLGKMFGSVEALNAVLALSGAQADTYNEKYAAMMEVTGATASAFDAQTQGVNSAAFQMQQLRNEVTVVAQQMGQALIPALMAAFEAGKPLIDWVIQLAQGFTELSPQQQQMIIGAAALAAALGPLALALSGAMTVISGLVPLVSALVSVVGALISPIGLVAVAVGGLLAILFDWGGANEKVAAALDRWGLSGAADFVRGLHEGMSALVETTKAFFSGNMTFSEFFEAAIPDWIATLFSFTWPILGPVGWVIKLMQWSWPRLAKPSWIDNLLNFRWPGFPTRPGWLGGGGDDDAQNNATGGIFNKGLTWVGERGPELVQLPAGSRVYTNQESAAMAGAGAVTVNINANVSGPQDYAQLARMVAREIQRGTR